jgi:hypothetical protein
MLKQIDSAEFLYHMIKPILDYCGSMDVWY